MAPKEDFGRCGWEMGDFWESPFLVTVPSWAQRLLCLICVLCESLAWSRKRALGDPPSSYTFPLPPTALGLKGTGAISLKDKGFPQMSWLLGVYRPSAYRCSDPWTTLASG